MKKLAYLFILFFSQGLIAQETTIKEGLPQDLNKEKIIFLKFEPIKITVNPKDGKADKYVFQRQENHNRVIDESNKKLSGAAMQYPFEYALASQSTYLELAKSGYKYVLISQVYKNEHLKKHPDEDILIDFEYFILDMRNNLAYKVFEMDEMKVYDSKMMIRRLVKALKKTYPEID